MALILFGSTIGVAIVLFLHLIITDELNPITMALWLVCLVIGLSPSVMEYADSTGTVIRYSPNGELLDKTERALVCVQHCANVPEVFSLPAMEIPTTVTSSALGPLAVSWQVTLRVRDWSRFARIFAAARRPIRLYDGQGSDNLKQLITETIQPAHLDVERNIHLALGFGNTSTAALGREISATLQPLLADYGLEVVTISTAAQLR